MKERFSGVIIVTCMLSLFAGVVGALIGTVTFSTLPVTDIDTLALLKNRRTNASASDIQWDALQNTIRASAVIVPTNVVGSGDIFLSVDDRLAMGMVLTSDGVVVTMRSAIPDKFVLKPTDMSVVVGKKVYMVEKVTVDPFTGIAFLKITAKDLPVVDIAYDVEIASGDVLFAPTMRAENVLRVDFNGKEIRVGAKKFGVSTESLRSVFGVSDADEVIAGSMLVGRDGKVVGMMQGDGSAKYGVPLGSISTEIRSVLDNGIVSRPYFGAYTLPLEEAVVVAGAKEVLVRGERVVNGPEGVAVKRRSPADVVGIVAGDVILTLGGESVSSRKLLADMIAEYEPGDRVRVGFERAGKTMEVEVVLGAVPVR